jgi:hypothetical protein
VSQGLRADADRKIGKEKGGVVKALLASFATGLVVFLGTTAFAGAGQQAVTPKQFAALTKRVTALEKANKVVLAYVGQCFNKWAPVTDYGPGGEEGYLYGLPDKTIITTSALDITNTGETPNFYVPAPTGDCSLNLTRFRALAGPTHQTRKLNLSPVGRSH